MSYDLNLSFFLLLPNIKVLRELQEAPPPTGWAPFASEFERYMGIAFVALLSALALALATRVLIRCLWRRHPAVALEQPTAVQLTAPPLEEIPAVMLSAEQGLTVAGLANCAICLQEFADGDVVRVLPNCGHVFHAGCIDLWIPSRHSCPTCRESCLLQPERLAI